MLQGRIDILRAERTARLKGKGVTDVDVERLTDILSFSAQRAPDRRGRVSHIYCAECGFQNPEASNFCSRCGATLNKAEADEQTMTFTPDEVADDPAATLHDLGGKGPGARLARPLRPAAGRGRASSPAGRTLIGRSPECDVFLDDVTVSRKHAELVRDDDGFTISDLGSLNGTFVNRKRIETATLEDDDELQIGKFRRPSCVDELAHVHGHRLGCVGRGHSTEVRGRGWSAASGVSPSRSLAPPGGSEGRPWA